MALQMIPGAAEIGFGFNVLGEYSTKSMTNQIFRTSETLASWTYPPTKTEYGVPDNVFVDDVTGTRGQTYIFETKTEFEEHFAASASVEVSAGAFSGEFSAAYSSAYKSSNSYYFSMVEALYDAWSLKIESSDRTLLDDDFVADLNALPMAFDRSTSQAYFNFLTKWGTHYISATIVGGSFRYYLAIDKSQYSDKKNAEANATLEYDAVFVSSTATAKSEWDQLSQHWAQSRNVSIRAEGGDTNPLTLLQPAFEDSDSTVFTAWRASVMTNPAVTGFTLTPVWQLAQGQQQNALHAATDAFTSETVAVNVSYIESYTQSSAKTALGVLVGDTSIQSTDAAPAATLWTWQGGGITPYYQPTQSVFLAVVDRSTRVAGFIKSYYFPRMANDDRGHNPLPASNQPPWDEIGTDLDAATTGKTNFVVIFVCTGFYGSTSLPVGDIANRLQSYGATFKEWQQKSGYTDVDEVVMYAFIGFSDRSGVSVETYDYEGVNPRWPVQASLTVTTPLDPGATVARSAR